MATGRQATDDGDPRTVQAAHDSGSGETAASGETEYGLSTPTAAAARAPGAPPLCTARAPVEAGGEPQEQPEQLPRLLRQLTGRQQQRQTFAAAAGDEEDQKEGALPLPAAGASQVPTGAASAGGLDNDSLVLRLELASRGEVKVCQCCAGEQQGRVPVCG